MAQHFLYSAAAKTLTLAQIFRMTDDEAYGLLKSMRWDGGEPVCPHCGGCTVYEIRTRKIFKCKGCRQQFSLTSGTLFASFKRPLRDYLAAIALFVNGSKGVSALQMSRELGMAHKSAFVLLHKLREAMAADAPETLGGTVEIDGGWFGGHIREANMKADRVDRRRVGVRIARRAVVVARERGGRTVTNVFANETDSTSFILSTVEPGTVIHTDEGHGWDRLRHHYVMNRVNHQLGYSIKGACTNQAESFFARMRRAEIGTYHCISGAYLTRYAAEMAWREDHRRKSNGEQFNCVAGLAIKAAKSDTFTGYWQRRAA
jgi:transposase-like protein